MRELKAGIIGLGVGEKHIPAYESHPECRVLWACDFSRDKLDALHVHYPEIQLTTAADELLAVNDLDVVSVASFDNYHFDQVCKAVKSGKHVFVEKPLCLFREEAVEIRRVLDANPGVRISSNLNLRTCPRFVSLKQDIQSGAMGDIFHIEADYLWGRLFKLTEGWRGDMDFYSIVHGAAVHMIDLIIWLIGKLPVEVMGMGNRIASSGSKMKFNDFAALLLRFEDGMTAKVTANGGCKHPHFHRVAVFGTEATFDHGWSGATVVKSGDPKDEMEKVTDEYPGVSNKGLVVTTFLDSILNPAMMAEVPDQDVFDTMSVCFAAEKAVEEGGPVSIEYI